MIARIQKAMKEKDGGFTLVELIVVVVIIGVLAAIAVPVFLNQAKNSKIGADKAALSNAKIAVSSYMADNGGGTTAPTAAQLASYGWPATPTITIPAYDSGAGTYSLDIATSASKSTLHCIAAQNTEPSCS